MVPTATAKPLKIVKKTNPFHFTKMSNDDFRQKAKQFLNNKFIIARTTKGDHYKTNGRAAALCRVQSIFSSFLSFANCYSVGDLAIKIKRHEDLLLLILPNPQNPSYNQALTSLQELIEYAQNFINDNNLQTLINK